MKEFAAENRLADILALLDGSGCKCMVHRNDEDEYSFLKDGEVSVEIPNPYVERAMFIDLQDEISLFFGDEWHGHYYPDEEGFRALCETVRGIMSNELCSVGHFDERGHQGGGCLAAKSDDLKMSCGYIDTVSRLIEEYKAAWGKWDPKDDRTIIFG
ncbi:MAG: hypothetical protein NC299_06755 [Lachnospiraceae bacterium]|nr:hypothetical protein [Ruminococcus sp.]MCM1275054.1 hypothetical protein [Lachnospiraceae bacterium]